MTTLVIFHSINYNSFFTTLLFTPVCFISSYYAQLVVQAKMWNDPYTLEKLEDHDVFIGDEIFKMISLVLLLLAHHYLVQKNLVMIVIEKHMLARQQTQLQSFF